MRKPKTRTVGRVHLHPRRGRAGGVWYWQAYLSRPGGRDDVSRHIWPGRGSRWRTIEQAEMDAMAWQANDGRARMPSPEEGRAAVQTVRDLLEVYIGAREVERDALVAEAAEQGTDDAQRRAYKATRAVSRDRSMARHQLLAAGDLGRVATSALTYSVLCDGQRRILAAGYSRGTARNAMLLLSRAWKWARRLGYVPRVELDMPSADYQPPAVEELATPSTEHVSAVYDRLSGHRRAHLLLLWCSGARKMEAARLRWGDVATLPSVGGDGRPFGQITIRRSVSKTGRRRVVAIGPDALARLLEMRPEDAADGDRIVTCSLSWAAELPVALREAAEAAEVPPFDCRGVRRRALRDILRGLVESGRPDAPMVYAHMAGHSLAVAMRHYLAMMAEQQTAGAVRLAVVGRGDA